MNERPAVNRLREAMRNALIASALATASPAHACHHYSRWYYPTPQPRCGLDQSHPRRPIAHRAEESHDWYVEFVLPEPAADPDPGRTQGVEALKRKLEEEGSRQ